MEQPRWCTSVVTNMAAGKYNEYLELTLAIYETDYQY